MHSLSTEDFSQDDIGVPVRHTTWDVESIIVHIVHGDNQVCG